MLIFLFSLKDINRIVNILGRLLDLLYKYENDILGVEYLTFLHDSKNDNFGCLLCTKFKKGSLQSMIDHFKSKPHCEFFLQKHFPNVFERLEKIEKDIKPSEDEYRSLLKSLVREITKRCPKEHPIVLSTNEAISCKIEVTREIFEASKSKEKATNTLCIDLIIQINDFAKKIQQKRHESLSLNVKQTKEVARKPITINDGSSDGEIFDDMESKIQQAKSKVESTKRQRDVKSNSRRRSRSRESSVNQMISEYKYRFEKASKIIESDYEQYKIVPDSHPNYNSEWNYYWIRKIKINPEVDYNSSNFIEAWKKYFRIRLEELELEENLKARIRIRRELKLPVDPIDNRELERVLSNESDDKRMAENFNYEEVVRKNSPKRKRAAISMDEIEEVVRKKMTIRDQLIVEQKFSPYKSLRDPRISKNLKTTSAKIAQSFTDANNNEISNKSNLQEEPSENEKDSILIMKVQELILLYENYHNLTDEIKSQLTAYMEELKKMDPEKYEQIINHELPVNRQEAAMSDEDSEDYDEELMRNASKNAKTLTKPPEQEYINLSATDTEYVDMTVSD